ncbi:MAG TPA: histidine kinase [Burkholderiaceae bacterium]|nr:histidine kinase [Burkholderiaceae bacterium]
MTCTPTQPSGPAPRRRLPFAVRGLIVQAVCLGIAALLTVFGTRHETFLVNWVYSIAIGASCWLFIEGGRRVAAWLMNRRAGTQAAAVWPGSLSMVAITVLGAAGGYTLGTGIGDAFSGHHSPSLLHNQVALLVTALTTVGASYYFYASERLHHERAAAESARRLALENQLRLLESQLEPHMLFNTLANLRVLIGIDPPRAQAMLDRLIAFLRATFEASRERMHPLATEFERLADYLQLMAVRMGPRLQFTLELPATLRELPIPPLLLQPLVENAIKHGLEPQVAGGQVSVSASRQGERLRIDVRDTGAGLDPGVPATRGTQFGTRQITDRLHAVYGEAATFSLQPAGDAQGGTLARIELPWPPTSRNE